MRAMISRLLKKHPTVHHHAQQFYRKHIVPSRAARKSYAQLGEDLIVSNLLNWIQVRKPTYLDIGAHHPTFLSNTYIFYQRKCHGVCVEPDPTLCRKIKRRRPRDICLNVGIGVNDSAGAEFFVMDSGTLNTFSRAEAESAQKDGHRIVEVIRVPLVNINDVIGKNFDPWPNFLSLDIEGLDYQVLESLDFERFRPEVICVETLSFTTQRKIQEIIDLVCSRGYVVGADTMINTIFVEKSRWDRMLPQQAGAADAKP